MDFSKLTPLGKIAGYQKVERNVNSFTTAVKTNPLFVTLNADELQLYKGGVFGKEKNCSTAFNHAVILVGYGADAASQKNFYVIRNSWGGTWGEKGYFRIEADGNTCGIHTNYGWYPKLK
jgi:C1A family cysteine protease